MNNSAGSPTPNPQPPTRITVAVGAIVTHGEQILLIQRGHPPGEGLWTIPGGRVEVDETLPEAVRREIQEECGIAVEPGQPAIMLDRLLHDATGTLTAHYLIVDFWATVAGSERPTVAASSDARAAGWFTMAEIRQLPTTLNLLSYLEEALRRRNNGGCLVVADLD